MPQFHFRATAPDGTPIDDHIEADSAHQATLRLQERGYTVNSVQPVQAEFAQSARARQLTWTDLEMLTRQLLSIAERELPMVPALKAFTADMPASGLKAVFDQVRIDLERGTSLEEALRNRGNALPPIYASAVRAGEAAGVGLPGILRILLRHSSRMIALQQSLHAALAYPLLVVALASAVFLLFLMQVLPGTRDVMRDVGMERNLAETISDNIVPIGASAILAAVALLFFSRSMLRSFSSSLQGDRVKLRIPRFGRVYYLVTLSRFSRTLAALLAARVPIMQALELAGAASGSPMLQQAVGDAGPRVALGTPLAESLRETGYFPASYCWLLETAEQRNAAEEALENLAESDEREAAALDQMNMQLVGPLALLGAGLLVLLVAGKMVSPMFGIFGLVGN